jgi:hypothetical protein
MQKFKKKKKDVTLKKETTTKLKIKQNKTKHEVIIINCFNNMEIFTTSMVLL